ncbi:MAG: arsenic resistance N-acetyltransferase ArsN2 [Gemmatimonadota bacterium]
MSPNVASADATLRPATDADLPAVKELLAASGLPTAGVTEAIGGFVVAESSHRIVGVVGLELCGENALLRSTAVASDWSGRGLGRRLVEQIIADAKSRGLDSLYLLTTTAERYFPSFGFVRTTREHVPQAMRKTTEFVSACPASATVMHLSLRALSVLFLCTGNSARSQIAEALLSTRGKGRFRVGSAGVRPAPAVNPFALEALRERGIDWTGHAPKTIDAIEHEHWDFVITVCDNAKESCPIFPGQPVFAHWGMHDPAEVSGEDFEKREAFRLTTLLLARRIDLLLALPLETLERRAQETRLGAIGAPRTEAQDAAKPDA